MQTPGIKSDILRQQATFYRAALLLGLLPGATVVRWAHEVIERAGDVPAAFLDVVLTPPTDLTALRHALQPLSDEAESTVVLAALLDLVSRDLMSGRRSLGDTVTVLSQVRRFLTVSPAVEDDLDELVDDFMLASAGVVGDLSSIEGRVRVWLASYAGAALALRAVRTYHVMEFDRGVEAAAFVAALSRFLDSPAAHAFVTSDEPVEVWSLTASGNRATLYLTEHAMQAAQYAFSPVPAAGVLSTDAWPHDAVRVLDDDARRAMGVEEAERRLGGGR